MIQKKKLALLGATGSIGDSVLRILEKHSDRLELVAVGAHTNADALGQICARWNLRHAALTDAQAFSKAQNDFPKNVALSDSLIEISTLPEVDCVVVATVGTAGLEPTLAALRAKKQVALANKEVLVMAGSLVMAAAREHGAEILPLDSEHCALAQCLEGNSRKGIDKVFLTASGGAFRDLTLEQMRTVTPQQALAHPNWAMGPKVTLDCATLANKGLELIEAHHLFGLPASQLGAIFHRQSLIHAIVQFVDGCWIAQLSPPKMIYPIQYALLGCERHEGVEGPIDLSKAFTLDLAPPDYERFPALNLALEALHTGNAAPAIFNAANDVGAYAFLEGRLPFLKIAHIIERTLETMDAKIAHSLENILAIDRHARIMANSFLN